MRRIRSSATAYTRTLLHAHFEAARTRVPVQDVLANIEMGRLLARQERMLAHELSQETLTTKRASLTADTDTMSMSATTDCCKSGSQEPRIVIVGAGLAGIRCAHLLWTARRSLASTVYEAATDHIGGRCWSLRGFFDNGLVAEHGGSFINHDEHVIRDLAKSFGLEEVIVDGGNLPDRPEVFWIDGAIYSTAEANNDWASIGYEAFLRAHAAAPWPQTFARNTEAGRRLDGLSVTEWLDDVGIGAASRLGRLMQQHAISEFGGDPGDQSALNLLSLLGQTNRNSLDPFPGYDEKYVIAGGNDQLISKMVEAIPPETIRQGHTLTSVKLETDGTYTCTFDRSAGGILSTSADFLVLTLPFRMLREVDLSAANFSLRKMTAIKELGFGSIGKIHVQLNSKPWVPLEYAGAAYSDPQSFGVVWDDSVHLGHEDGPSLMTIYPGAGVANSRLTLTSKTAHGPAPASDVDWFVGEVENIYTGMRQACSKLAFEDNWPQSPNHKGALAYWRVGQVTAFSGIEGQREGNALFAGEHTNKGGSGFMESAIVSGERAARTIIKET